MRSTPYILIVFLLTLSAEFSIAQSDTIIRFLGYNYKPTDEKQAFQKTVCIIRAVNEGSYSVKDYYFESRKIMVIANYNDSKLTQLEGLYEVYSKSGTLLKKGIYSKNQPEGIWKSWSENGVLIDSVNYFNGNITGTRKRWWGDGKISDSTVYDQNGRGKHIGWHNNGIKRSEGSMINDKKTGSWNFYQKSGKLAAEELYEEDSLISIRCFDENGKQMKGECVAEKDAEFSKGPAGWNKYLSNKMNSRMKELVANAKPGIVYVSFVVGLEGKIEDVTIENPKGGYFEAFVLEIFRSAPDWIPARQHNIPVRAFRKQPIAFQF